MSICFISPHLDDVALSCCNKINQFKRQGFKVIVITVFTGHLEGTPINIFTDMDTRIAEDKKAMEILDVTYFHLGFLDSIYQKKNSIMEIRSAIEEILEKYNCESVYLPLAIGNHPDHLIVHQIGITLNYNKNCFFMLIFLMH